MVNVWGGERLGGERLTIVISNSYHLVCTSNSLEFYDRNVFDDPKVLSDEIMDFNDQRLFDDFKVFDDPKVFFNYSRRL